MGLLTTLERRKKKTPLITIKPLKNKIQPLQNFGPLNVKLKNCEKCYYVHNIFQYFRKKF